MRARGETEQRLYTINAWREVPHIYSGRERAALAWNQQVADAVYETASQEFSDVELAQLTLAIVAIKGWNRFNVAIRTPAGSYQSTVARKTG